jgi:hypothetical protein
MGGIIAGPAVDEEILYAELSLGAVRLAKSLSDVAGHYSRPDVFKLSVDRRPRGQINALDAVSETHRNQADHRPLVAASEPATIASGERC